MKLGSESSPLRTEDTVPGRNTELVIITYVFAGLFLLLAGYLIWFQIFRRPAVKKNVYNTREEVTTDRVIRGAILSRDGTRIAYTDVDYTGNEVRVYPYANIFSHTVGYATNGRSGLEASLNSILMNSHSSLLDQIQNAYDNKKVQGDNVIVTLDPKLQQAAYYALGDRRGAVVVMEPDSGKILAMVSKPDFDPNTIAWDWEQLTGNENSTNLLNRATQGLYPPGSTFKILTTLAYMRQNPENFESFLYNCQGSLYRDEVNITCYDGHVHGEQTLDTAFANSCNTAYATIGLSLDKAAFRKMTEKFFFNRQLPGDIPHQSSVFALDRNSSEAECMTTAIGQGDTLVTPLHMAMITSAIANGGIMMKPMLVSSVETYEGAMVEERKPSIAGQLMTVDEAQALNGMMEKVVKEGTAQALSWNSYSVAGKTGSAEYDTGEYRGTHSWFVGYSNVEDPDIALAVIAEDGGTGSETAVPIAQQIFDAYYYS